MKSRRVRSMTTTLAMLCVAAPVPAPAYMAVPATLVGPPIISLGDPCRISFARPGGGGPGAAIPFPLLMLGAPVRRTATSFTTGGGGTSNAMIEEQRKKAGLPYAPPTVNTAGTTLPATFAVTRGTSMTSAPYQRLPLTPSKGIFGAYGLIYSQATSATRGRIVALTLTMAGRPAAPPRLRVTVLGPRERGCQRQTVEVYAPTMSATAVAGLFSQAKGACGWSNLANCTRAQWPRGRVLFVSPSYRDVFEYRWIDYDMLAEWHFASTRNR